MKKIQTSKILKSKQQILRGVRHLVDTETGELVDVVQAINEVTDINFHKVWIVHLIQTFDILGNKKMKVVNYILDNLNWSTNVLLKTQKEISDETGVGFNTVNTTIQKLLDVKFLKKKVGGVYMLSPDILAYGGQKKRQHLLITFEKFGEEKEKKDEEDE